MTVKLPKIDLFWEFSFDSTDQPCRELLWLMRHGSWCFGRNAVLTFGAGRLWYDGSYWYAHFAWWSVSLGYISK